MRLKTKRLILRELNDKDQDDLMKSANNLNVSKNLLVIPYPYNKKDAEWFIGHCKEKAIEKPRSNYEFGIEFNKKIIGIITLAKVDEFNGTATLGLWLAEEYWRKGIMTEAAKEVIDFSFEKLNLRRINSEAFADNKASIEFQKKLGFRKEGLSKKKDRSKATSKIHDSVIFGLLKEEWKK